MTFRLIVSQAARRDAQQILSYLEEGAGSETALRFALEFDASIDRIADFPLSGSLRPQFGSGIRVMIVDPYLVFYDAPAPGDAAIVLRILDGRRDITRAMFRKVD